MNPAELPFLPYARPSLDASDLAAVEAVLRSGWLTTGPVVPTFERAFAERVGAARAVACSSGTAALHLAYAAAGFGPGDAVIVPSITFLATANAACMVGAEPIFADCDPATGLLTEPATAAAIARAIGAGLRVRAIVPVHLAGQCADLAPLAALAAYHGAVLIEDACHALGTETQSADGSWRPVGACSHSLMTVFSLHAVKTIAAGEGGVVTTNDPELAARLERLRCHGMDRSVADETQPWRYAMQELGWNYRLSDIHAALAESQLRRLDDMLAHRRWVADRYARQFQGSAVTPITRIAGSRPGWHLYPVLPDFAALGTSRGAVVQALHAQGIGTQVHYIPVHTQPFYARRPTTSALPGADAYYARTLTLPLYCGMAADDVDRVADTLLGVLSRQPSSLGVLNTKIAA